MQLRALIDGRFAFFQEFLKHPFQIGSIIPSSRFLEYRIVEAARISSAKTIVELGPGCGGTTRAILRAMTTHARLLSIEINTHFHDRVSRIGDERLVVHLGSAHALKEIISMHRLSSPEVVISGIPFSTMSHISGTQILEAISSTLAPGGRFVAHLGPIFSTPAKAGDAGEPPEDTAVIRHLDATETGAPGHNQNHRIGSKHPGQSRSRFKVKSRSLSSS